ncbi:hypothetical protein LCGC14_1408450 [marine sediment metagenome]|uniref:M23ase beta-sheet core domain-containing protein n=1 Tax=marine sediment metagenome TaxID=412755 RepID=A0A0F9MAA4_9ZZZZ
MALYLGPITDKKYRITHSFKAHPKFGCPGTDIGYPMGTPLKAVFDGTISSGTNPDIPGKILPKEDWGKYQWLTSSKNKAVKVAYTHLSKFRVKSDKVKKGQIVSYSGNSGYSFGAHLHFALSYRGKCIDPFNSPNVVVWGKEDEVTELESKVASFIYLYRAILNIHPNAKMKKYFLYLAKKGIDPATWSRSHYFTPKISNLNTIIEQQASQLKTLAGQVKELQDEIKQAPKQEDIGELRQELKDCKEMAKMPPKGPEKPKKYIIKPTDSWYTKLWKTILNG